MLSSESSSSTNSNIHIIYYMIIMSQPLQQLRKIIASFWNCTLFYSWKAMCGLSSSLKQSYPSCHFHSYQHQPQKKSQRNKSLYSSSWKIHKTLCFINTDIHFSRGTPKQIRTTLLWKRVLSILLTDFTLCKQWIPACYSIHNKPCFKREERESVS